MTTIDPSAIVESGTSAVTTAVNGNLGDIAVVMGGLMAVGAVVRLLTGLVGRKKG